MKYVILGGGCSFAMHLSRYLLTKADTEKIVAVGRSPQKPRCFTLGTGDDDPRYEYHVRHFRDVVDLLDYKQPKVVINFAAEGESRASFDQSWRYFETNCVASAHLIEAIKDKIYINRFVQISTGEVYGSVDHPVREDEHVNPTSPYAASKAAFDAYLMAMMRKRGLRMNIVRPANTYGEGQQLHRFIPKAILYGLTGRRIPLYGAGHGLKSYLHAEDLARAIYLLCNKGAPISTIYNIAPKMPVSMKQIAEVIARQLNTPISQLCEDVGLRKGTDAQYWFDGSAAERAFGFKPEISLEEGIARTIEWVHRYKDELSGFPNEYAVAA